MGQYYLPTFLGKRYGIKGWLSPFEYDNGMKLMEHSYMGNILVDAAIQLIMCNPMRVAWIGDYSDEPYGGDEPYQKLNGLLFNKIYGSVYGKPAKAPKVKPKPVEGFDTPKSYAGWYLLNHTRKSYVDLGRFARENSWREEWIGRDGLKHNGMFCIHPLPLLTACGNGRGGGDYYSQYPDYDKVGLWAFDLIELNDGIDDGYTEEVYRFKEEE